MIKNCDTCKYLVSEWVVIGDRHSDGFIDYSCLQEDNPLMPFTVDETHPCPLWEPRED